MGAHSALSSGLTPRAAPAPEWLKSLSPSGVRHEGGGQEVLGKMILSLFWKLPREVSTGTGTRIWGLTAPGSLIVTMRKNRLRMIQTRSG